MLDRRWACGRKRKRSRTCRDDNGQMTRLELLQPLQEAGQCPESSIARWRPADAGGAVCSVQRAAYSVCSATSAVLLSWRE
jgi:hypothetical protein